MPFLPTDKTRILKYQAYSIQVDSVTTFTLSKLLDQQMLSLETTLPDIVAIVQVDLTALDTLDALLTIEQASANVTLKRADVLEWDTTRSKVSGIVDRMESLRSRVARMLSQGLEGRSGGGQGMLLRG